jgi:photosystem II protein
MLDREALDHCLEKISRAEYEMMKRLGILYDKDYFRMAEIQFSRGLTETVVPDVRLSRTKNGDKGSAKFYFNAPKILGDQQTEEITGMYLIDEEGEIVTREVKGKFINGKPQAIEATVIFNSPDEWDRFMRFMERYSSENGLEFTKSS